MFVLDAPNEIALSSDPELEDIAQPEGTHVDVHCEVFDCYPTPPTLSLQQSDVTLKSADSKALTY